ncbi:13315_t:CDS:1, partial [Funneliformis geosporum]
HSAPKSKGKIIASEMIDWYNIAMRKFNNVKFFEAILITNRDISKIDREKALAVPQLDHNL